MKTDPDLDGLRGDARFAAMIAAASARLEPEEPASLASGG
jgi:hypothetical protein